MSQKLIVVDSSHPLVRKNKCFDSACEYTGCGHALHVRLAREAKKRGIDIVTADEFLENHKAPCDAVCISDMSTPFTAAVLARGVDPAICYSLESPLVALRFYHNIQRYAGRFRHNFQFSGTQERLATVNTLFHPIVFPMETRVRLPLQPWNARENLVLINSNKRAVLHNGGSLTEVLGSVARQIRFQMWKLTDPWLRVREIYVDRIEAISYFSGKVGFRLYGGGWDRPISGFSSSYQRAAQRCYGGSVVYGENKRRTMSRFKYALCFENCAFPGYVTEKIIDCFLAGCVPVYLGAPDIADIVPTGTFIDFRQFGSFAELERFLDSISESDASHYLEAAQAFLEGPSFRRFDLDILVHEWLSLV